MISSPSLLFCQLGAVLLFFWFITCSYWHSRCPRSHISRITDIVDLTLYNISNETIPILFLEMKYWSRHHFRFFNVWILGFLLFYPNFFCSNYLSFGEITPQSLYLTWFLWQKLQNNVRKKFKKRLPSYKYYILNENFNLPEKGKILYV